MSSSHASPKFDKKADVYDNHAFIQNEMAQWLAEWLPKVKKGKALEVGAGTGLFTELISQWPHELVATDISETMISIGQKKYPHIPWKIADAQDLPHDQLDWIFSSSLLQWTQHPFHVLQHWHEKLAPKGQVLCGFFVEGTLIELNEFINGSVPLQWKNEMEWQMIFEKAGLNVLAAQTFTRQYQFSSCTALLRSLHGVGAVSSPKFSTGKLRGIIRQYEKKHPYQNGTVATFSFMRLLAQKD